MNAPLEGIRVVEVASWLAAPSCAALMADMGADVIKVEPPAGDTYRRMYTAMLGDDFVHPCYQFDNRGKRGVQIDLEAEQGVEMVHTLVRQADVFITNLMPCHRLQCMRFCRDTVLMDPIAIVRRSTRLPSGHVLERCRCSAIVMTGHFSPEVGTAIARLR
jgi:hypothetical protein